MEQIWKSLLLAGAMLLAALLAKFELVPAAFAQFAPFYLLVLLPWALSKSADRCCLRAGG